MTKTTPVSRARIDKAPDEPLAPIALIGAVGIHLVIVASVAFTWSFSQDAVSVQVPAYVQAVVLDKSDIPYYQEQENARKQAEAKEQAKKKKLADEKKRKKVAAD